MDTETQHPQDHDLGTPHWAEMGLFNSPHHPLGDFHGFTFGSSPIVPLEPTYSMSIPQSFPPQQLGPLTMAPQWPSMLSTQPNYAPVPLAPMPMPMPSHLQNLHATHVSSSPTPRRTLTDADRRRMCMYHEENPHVKQTEIGAMFGVERSTVSKVLRQKEKYLYPDDGRRSPIKKTKGKFPDIERALSNWARNHVRHGGELSDAMIRERALFFANSVGSPEGHQKLLSSSWLEKFKRKNYLPGSLSRKGSLDATNTSESPGTANSIVHTPNDQSSVSPSGMLSPSPVSPKQVANEFRKESIDCITTRSNDDFSQTFSPLTSPLGTNTSVTAFTSEIPFTPDQTTPGHNPVRQRSQTLPILAADQPCVSSETTEAPLIQGLEPSAIDDNVNAAEENPAVRRNRSQPQIKTELSHFSKSNTISPISSPGSPTQDEARRALELVRNYFQNQPSGIGAQEFMTIGKLMEKLELVQSQGTKLERIDEHADFPRMTKKRSIHTL
ncbi:hypothetical protein D8B26_003382 [Coccidioides posadasii str. Silveira]|uniref:Uncharacterized protein n=2 Tax=Coccidioides posadasii TaxID=199306 RepID=E9CZT1_COCPS|nr:hypothetical protein CPC735_004330 [Coccidioides posadasii C735 delta SOWgp]EER26262.1 hypothetical protein CPC735_004330 [Coccidioides posadasii C735 delta SOWgp]EFW20184.1 conserved hypothetical protein [Coccidioides posadasii str. Silveira]QVM08705.1 hypothetical protein D8B26_003382 [Coccidioides posadasii str. Silveira]|eukprot:XP_003068407.1 hypothetical protein CPC735_004330 [Coccidioides posadasii C735 delta SOWgp]